jgi:hypothetical protein
MEVVATPEPPRQERPLESHHASRRFGRAQDPAAQALSQLCGNLLDAGTPLLHGAETFLPRLRTRGMSAAFELALKHPQIEAERCARSNTALLKKSL